ncbi:hypothetical protein SAMN06273572_102413 [Monaibacterium marinum]|uniref:TnsA endonuclease N terminal n=1 Tax=Pontivivens marinum TaxID=1690039 RepID=A0A2C9CRE0_9RHOB|nr:hypothetical protein [Monaibacterium marinum]SOH93735.1 hypothetical protein SAMN06273572_102413 [Monaibacterium marinum]
MSTNHVWLAPKPSRAERKIPRKSNNHFVGELTFGEELGQGQTLGFESKLEHDIALMTIYHPEVVDVREQVKVVYKSAQGRYLAHYVDYVSTERHGRRTAIVVKPSYVSNKYEFKDLVARVAAAAIPSVVDRVVVATERVLDPLRFSRVEQFHSCRFAQPEFDSHLSQTVGRLEQGSSIRDFLRKVGLGPNGFHAVIRMIRFNSIEAMEPGILKLSSFIQRPQVFA